MSARPGLDALSTADLKTLVLTLLARVAALDRTVAAQRDEIARLKGLKGRPVIEPSGMAKGTQPKPGGKRAKRRGRGKVTPRVTLETKVLRAAAVPPGSQFKGYGPYQVQDLLLSASAAVRICCCPPGWCAIGASAG